MYSSRCAATNVVVRVRRLPAVDDEIPARSLDVAQELGADVAPSLLEELGPLAVRPEDALELRGVARHLVAEHECDHLSEDRVTGVTAEASCSRGARLAARVRRRPPLLPPRQAPGVAGGRRALGRHPVRPRREGKPRAAGAASRHLALGRSCSSSRPTSSPARWRPSCSRPRPTPRRASTTRPWCRTSRATPRRGCA